MDDTAYIVCPTVPGVLSVATAVVDPKKGNSQP